MKKKVLKTDNGYSINNITYDSLNDFFTNTDVKCPPSTMHRDNQCQHDDVAGRDQSWRFGDEKSRTNYYQTRIDPVKGKNLCAEAVKKTMADASYKKLIRQAMTYRKRINYEDHGFRLSVPRAIAGEDKVFGVYKNSRKPTVKIAINICGSASVEQEKFIKLAKIAVPTICALETAGIATEVYYCAFAEGTHPDMDYTATHVLIKSSQQRFNWTTFAPVFTLGSYRESIFLSWIYDSERVSGGLGHPMTESQISRCEFDYTSVIGFNAPGADVIVKNIFDKLSKK